MNQNPRESLNNGPQPIYSFEKDRKLRNILGDAQLKALKRDSSLKELLKLQTELVHKVDMLRQKYPDAESYAMFHVLGGSTPGGNNPVKYDDFPDDDSVEKFVNDLVERYK